MGKAPGKKERYEVLYEDIEKMVQQVLEGHSMLSQRFEGVRVELKEMRREVGNVGDAVTETRRRLDDFIHRFEAHEHAHTNR
jgi:predicted  nucleic acid-binding Zn-ribbon protein